MPGAWVQSLVGELISHMQHSMAKTTTTKKPPCFPPKGVYILSGESDMERKGLSLEKGMGSSENNLRMELHHQNCKLEYLYHWSTFNQEKDHFILQTLQAQGSGTVRVLKQFLLTVQTDSDIRRFILFNIYLFIQVVLGLSCGMRDLH